MKNELSIVNILLILAVAFLLVDKFISGNKGLTASSTTATSANIPEGSIVYINTDSLLSNYGFFKEEAAKLEQKEKKPKLPFKPEDKRCKESLPKPKIECKQVP